MKRLMLITMFFILFSSSLHGRGSITTSLAIQDIEKTNVRGELLKAFQSAYTAFLRNKSFPDDRKNIANYDVQFTETAENIEVYFGPRRKPGEKPMLGNLTSLGVAVKFIVSKQDYRVVKIESFR